MTEDEMAGRHHQLNGRELKKVPGNGGGQGSLAYYSPWGCKESDATERLNSNCIEYVDCLGEYDHFNNINSTNT